ALARSRRWLRSVTAPADAFVFDHDDNDSSPARVGRSVMRGALVVGALAPAVVIGLVVIGVPPAVFAQGAPGGQVFGTSDQTIGNGFRAFCKYFRVIIFFAGFVGFGSCGIMKMLKMPWGGVFTGSIICWAFAGLAQLFYSFSQGNEVEINSDLDY
nr:hypothetical protein [Pyrinomonadaceae bacterium]